jgi:hypothetical protein
LRVLKLSLWYSELFWVTYLSFGWWLTPTGYSLLIAWPVVLAKLLP